jgi:hypothetical protein
MNIGFIALETFAPTEKYKTWSKLFHVKEIISLDCALCPNIIGDVEEKDYVHLKQDEYYFDISNDLEWLIEKVRGSDDKQILAVIREPEIDCKNIEIDSRFKFCGYDLVEDDTRISALVNCGGFDKAFLPNELSEYGLIEEFEKAKAVQQLLMEKYPYEDHAFCTLWGIWRMSVKG